MMNTMNAARIVACLPAYLLSIMSNNKFAQNSLVHARVCSFYSRPPCWCRGPTSTSSTLRTIASRRRWGWASVSLLLPLALTLLLLLRTVSWWPRVTAVCLGRVLSLVWRWGAVRIEIATSLLLLAIRGCILRWAWIRGCRQAGVWGSL